MKIITKPLALIVYFIFHQDQRDGKYGKKTKSED